MIYFIYLDSLSSTIIEIFGILYLANIKLYKVLIQRLDVFL